MRRTLTALASAATLAVPAGNALAVTKAAPKKKIVTTTKTVVGPAVQADRWGQVQVTVVVRKTTTTIGKRTSVQRRLASLSATSPHHTGRSIEINSRAIPILRQEALTAQSANIDLVSGATDVSAAFVQSLQAAILQANRS